MKIKGIPDESIAASSSKSADNSPQFARLDGKKAWCSAPTDKEPHIQINLVEPKSITGITTQGSFSDWAWVTKYEVKYLEKGTWKHYDEVPELLSLLMLLLQLKITRIIFCSFWNFREKTGSNWLNLLEVNESVLLLSLKKTAILQVRKMFS